MISKAEIKSILGVRFNKKKQYVIYPFGENGMNVKEVLNHCFSVSPCLIVDNILSRHNKDIINAEMLYKLFDESMIVIFTMEDAWLHGKLLRELLEHIDAGKIIDLSSIIHSKQKIWKGYKQFELSELLPIDNKPHRSECGREKIKIRIYNFTDNCWNTLMSVAECFKKMDIIDLLILSRRTNRSKLVYSHLKESGYRQAYIEDYDPSTDKPDCFFLSHSCDVFTRVDSLREHCKLIIVASMDLLRYQHTWSPFWDMYNSAFMRFEPDYFLFDRLLYRDIIQSGFNSDRIIEMGNAKFDGIYEEEQNFVIPEEWIKLRKMRKIFLYATDHGVHDLNVTEDITLDLYGKCLFEYGINHEDIGIVFRPHPTLLSEMKCSGIWSDEEIGAMKGFFESTPNMVLDTTMNYNKSLVIADAIITDAYCGITCEAIPLNKPILMLYRDSSCNPYHWEIERCNYRADSQTEMIAFINMVIEGSDDRAGARSEIQPEIIKHYDGGNGERIVDFALKKLKEKTDGMNEII